LENLIKFLKESNCKITPQRIAIYNILKESNDHPNAEAIYRKLEPAYPTISLATIYKSLELFDQLGLIQVINIGENSFRYDCKAFSHPHLICSICHKVEDLNVDYFKDLTEKVESTTQYKISKQQLSFYGVCPECGSI